MARRRRGRPRRSDQRSAPRPERGADCARRCAFCAQPIAQLRRRDDVSVEGEDGYAETLLWSLALVLTLASGLRWTGCAGEDGQSKAPGRPSTSTRHQSRSLALPGVGPPPRRKSSRTPLRVYRGSVQSRRAEEYDRQNHPHGDGRRRPQRPRRSAPDKAGTCRSGSRADARVGRQSQHGIRVGSRGAARGRSGHREEDHRGTALRVGRGSGQGRRAEEYD